MLNFEKLNVSDGIKSVLMKYKVDFVFQPIYVRRGEIIGYEALMRPEGKDVMEFIEEMKEADKLHELELLSFFGATMAYKQRGYDTMLSINSFPSECFSPSEALEYSLCFRPIKEKLIIEMLEYTDEKHWTWDMKKKHVETYMGIEVALDDFGTGNNDANAIEYYQPHMIKLDHTLVLGIDKDEERQNSLKKMVSDLHKRTIVVLAEGVETQAEYECLLDIGVDFFQGFYLGRPA